MEDTIKLQVGDPGGGVHQEEPPIKLYQKGLLTDEKAGFNAYYLTDTPTLTKDTTKLIWLSAEVMLLVMKIGTIG